MDRTIHRGAHDPLRPSPGQTSFPFQLLIAFFVFVMLLYANIELLPGTGAAATFKDILIALAGAGLVFGVNHYANSIGAEPAARGDPMAILVSTAGFALTATLVGTMSFAGMTIGLADRAELDRHGRDLAAAVARSGQAHMQTLVATMKSAGVDFGTQAAGERNEGTTTGKKSKPGAREPVADFFGRMQGRMKTAVESLEGIDRQKADAIKSMKTLVDSYAKTSSDETLSRADRRHKLQTIDGEIRSGLASLDTEKAKGIARTLLAELRKPVVADAGTPDLRRGLDVAKEAASAHAGRLEELLSQIGGGHVVAPPFPLPARVTAGFRNLSETWPYAVLSYGLELIGGLSIWLYSVIHYRRIARGEAEGATAVVGANELPTIPQSTESIRLETSPAADQGGIPLGEHPHRLASRARMLEQDSRRTSNGVSKRKLRGDIGNASEEDEP